MTFNSTTKTFKGTPSDANINENITIVCRYIATNALNFSSYVNIYLDFIVTCKLIAVLKILLCYSKIYILF